MGIKEVGVIIILASPFLYCMFSDVSIKCDKKLNREERRKRNKRNNR